MSTYERSIVSIIEPTIKVDQLYLEDSESIEAKENTSSAVPEGINPKLSARIGAYIPLIQINTTKFDTDEIVSMSFSLKDKIPTIYVAFKDNNKKFSVNFPLDGDVISLYLRPPDIDNQRPIRVDFDIKNILSNPELQIYTIYGIMKIPGMFKEICKAFPEDISFNHFQTICGDLQIGFASNETTTNDKMKRICGFTTIHNFLNEMIESAYKDDDSFFDFYIDPYYYLCLVNLNTQFSLEDKTEDINISYAAPLSGMVGMQNVQDSIKGSLVLTNDPNRAGTNIYIENYSLENNTGSVWIDNGYKRYAQWFDIETTSYNSIFVDPLTTHGSETEFILLRGRRDETIYKDQNKYKWLGKQDSINNDGNVHSNYLFSKILNIQNLAEIQKMVLKVTLSGMNFYTYKYMRVPVLIYTMGNSKNVLLMDKRDENIKDSNDGISTDGWNQATGERADNPMTSDNLVNDPRNMIKNEFLSGYYLIQDIEYIYTNPGPVKQRLTLIRREWPIPGQNKDQ